MSWLVFIFALECGISPQIDVIQYEPREADSLKWGVGYTQLEAEIELFALLFAGASVRTYITPSGPLNFSPNTSVYDWRCGLRWKMLELGWRHRCFHPTIPYQPIFKQVVTGIEGAYDELYFRAEISTKGLILGRF